MFRGFREIRTSEKITEKQAQSTVPAFVSQIETNITIEETKEFWDELFASMEEA